MVTALSNGKRLNLRLSQQGLVLVAIPLLFELALLTTFLVLLNNADRELEREARSRAVLERCNMLSGVVIESGSAAMTHVLTGSGSSTVQSELKLHQEETERNLTELNALLASSAERPAGEKISSAVQKFMVQLASVGEAVQNSGSFALSRTRHLRSLAAEIQNSIREITQKEESAVDIAHRKYVEVKGAMNLCVFVAFGINILLASILLLYFNKAASARLTTLTVNTDRLAHQQALLPRLNGDDEFARLDKTFHEMASKLESANRLRTELMQMVAHDLRAPMSSILLSLQSIERGLKGEISDGVKDEVSRMLASSRRLIALINDLLDLELLQGGTIRLEKRDTSFLWIIERSVEAVESMAKLKSIHIEYPDEAPMVKVDPNRIVQVLVNFLSNAIKFSDQGSRIDITVAVLSSEAKGAENNVLELRVKDQGRGISSEKIAILFQRFSQVEAADRQLGSGLGLAISKALIEGHGGTIGCESEAGKGSQFWFRLPFSAQASEALAVNTSSGLLHAIEPNKQADR